MLIRFEHRLLCSNMVNFKKDIGTLEKIQTRDINMFFAKSQLQTRLAPLYFFSLKERLFKILKGIENGDSSI